MKQSWRDPDSYFIPVVIAVLVHVLVVFFAWWQWPGEKKLKPLEPPKHIQAKVVQLDKKKPVKPKKVKPKPKPAKKKQPPKKKQPKKKNDKKKIDKKKQDKKRQQEIAKKKAAEKKRKEQLKREKEAQERKEREEREQREQEELEMQQALEQEQQERELARQLEQEQWQQQADEVTYDYLAQIQTKISQVWYYPPNARPEMEIELSVQLLPTGEVLQVDMVRSSGNDAVDRSAMTAVKAASPLPVPEDIRIFEQRFRKFTLVLRPENATW